MKQMNQTQQQNYNSINQVIQTKDKNNIAQQQNIDDQNNNSYQNQILKKYCKQYNINEDQITYDYQNSQDGNTVAMWMATNEIIPDMYWYHDPDLKNNQGLTVFQICLKQKIFPPALFCKNQVKMVKFLNSKAMNLAIQKRFIPLECYHDPQLVNYTHQTVAMILAQNNKIIPKEWYHNPSLTNSKHETVAMIMRKNGRTPQKEWIYDGNFDKLKNYLKQTKNQFYFDKENNCFQFNEQIYQYLPDKNFYHPYNQDLDGNTVAMILTLNNVSIPKQLEHNPFIKNNNGQTIFNMFIRQKRIPPPHFCREANYQDQYRNTQAMILAWNNIEIPEYLYHDPTIQNQNNFTVALLQAENGKIPDKHWLHNKFIRVKYFRQNKYMQKYYTVQNFLNLKNIEIPEEWKYDNIVDNYDNTRAMIQAKNGQIPNKEYYHDSCQTNMNKETVAMILASHNITIPEKWYHNKFMTNNYNLTIAEILSGSDIIPSQQWMITQTENNEIFNRIQKSLRSKQMPVPHNINKEYLTIFDQACYGIFPDIKGHKPDEQDEDGWTVAMILAFNNDVIPIEWYHDKFLKNKWNKTVAEIISRKGITPPQQWMIIKEEDENIFNNIQTNIESKNKTRKAKCQKQKSKKNLQKHLLYN